MSNLCLSSKVKNLVGRLKAINSYCSLYDDALKKHLGSDLVDSLIIDTKELYLKYDELYSEIYDKGL